MASPNEIMEARKDLEKTKDHVVEKAHQVESVKNAWLQYSFTITEVILGVPTIKWVK